MFKPLILIGAGGHGKVVLDAAIKAGYSVVGFLDDYYERNILGYRWLGKLSEFEKYVDKNIFIISIGDNILRKKISKTIEAEWASIIHPSAIKGMNVIIGLGTVVMAGTVLNSCVRIGRHCIINTSAVIEHDCIISNYVHISPGVVLCGGVNISDSTWIGAGAVIKNGISICQNVIIGAGAVVVKDILQEGTYIGIPAKLID